MAISPFDAPSEQGRREQLDFRIDRAESNQAPAAMEVQKMGEVAETRAAHDDIAGIATLGPAQVERDSEEKAIGAHGITSAP